MFSNHCRDASSRRNAVIAAVLLLAVLAVAFLSSEADSAVGDEVEHDGLTYRVVGGSDGSFQVEVSGCDREGDVVIPSSFELDGAVYTVTSIAAAAFSGNGSVVTVEVPDTVVSLGMSVFYGCESLETVVLGSGVSSIRVWSFNHCPSLTAIRVSPENGVYASDGGVLFTKDMSELVRYPSGLSGDYEVPGTVSVLAAHSFSYSEGLESVSLPESVGSIGTQAFFGCCNLTEIRYGCTDAVVGELAFTLCTEDQEHRVCTVHGPVGILDPYCGSSWLDYYHEEGDGAEMRVGSLTYTAAGGSATLTGVDTDISDLTLSETVSAGGREFVLVAVSLTEANHDVRSLTIPSTVVSVDGPSLRMLPSLEEIEVDPGNARYTAADGVLYTSDMEELVCCPADYPYTLTVPSGVVRLGDSAFTGSSVGGVTLPDTLTAIPDDAFRGCSQLGYVHIGSGTESIGRHAFYGCSSLSTVTVSADNVHLRSHGNCVVDSDGTLVLVPDSTSGEFRISEDVTSLAEGVFDGCSLITSVVLNGSLAAIPEGAFSGCASLRSFIVPDGSPFGLADGALVSSDGRTLIAYPAALGGTYTVPEGVTSIGARAFAYSSVSVLHLHDGVVSIGDRAFLDSDLKTVRYACTDAQVGELAFETRGNLRVVVGDACNEGVLDGAVSGDTIVAYCMESDDGSGLFYFIQDDVAVLAGRFGTSPHLEVPSTATISGTGYTVWAVYNQAFMDDLALVSVSIPGTVVLIGELAFSGCSNLRTVELSEGLEEIWEDAFSGTGIGEVTIPGTVRYMEPAFDGCFSLTTVSFAEGAEDVYTSAFQGCTSLTTLHLPSTMARVHHNAFDGCPLETVYCLSDHVVWRTSAGSGAEVEVYALSDGAMDVPDGGAALVYRTPDNSAPVFSVPGGRYTDDVVLELTSAAPEAVIHYTLDGGVPTEDSPVYTGPIVIDGDTIVRAVAVVEGMWTTDVVTEEYDLPMEIPLFILDDDDQIIVPPYHPPYIEDGDVEVREGDDTTTILACAAAAAFAVLLALLMFSTRRS